MRNIGLLCVRNEIDVLPESLEHHSRFFETIVAQDGSSDGGTDLLRACPNIVKLFLDSDVVKPGERFSDGHRNVALDWIREQFGVQGVWVTLLHADEFWFDDPVIAAMRAQAADASHVLWGEFRFFLHTSDEGNLELTLPVTKRVKYYCGPFFEERQFCLEHHQVYLPGLDHCTLPAGPGKPTRWKHIPRYRHYPYRSWQQALNAYVDKFASRYWQPDHGWLTGRSDPYVDCLPKPTNSPRAKWDRVARFDGTLPNPADFLPD